MMTTYKSRFIKADMRAATSAPGTVCYTSHHDVVTITDITLAPATSLQLALSDKDQHIILPVSGAVATGLEDDLQTIASEEMLVLFADKAQGITVRNPFDDITVNLLHIVIAGTAHNAATGKAAVDITAKNKLFSASGAGSRLHIGIYDSRTKDHYTLQPGSDSIYTYVINGSFDFEDRLMEYRDGLFQWDIQEAEFEALSDTAVLLIIECSLTK